MCICERSGEMMKLFSLWKIVFFNNCMKHNLCLCLCWRETIRRVIRARDNSFREREGCLLVFFFFVSILAFAQLLVLFLAEEMKMNRYCDCIIVLKYRLCGDVCVYTVEVRDVKAFQ
jgi:hypothetical protein